MECVLASFLTKFNFFVENYARNVKTPVESVIHHLPSEPHAQTYTFLLVYATNTFVVVMCKCVLFGLSDGDILLIDVHAKTVTIA